MDLDDLLDALATKIAQKLKDAAQASPVAPQPTVTVAPIFLRWRDAASRYACSVRHLRDVGRVGNFVVGEGRASRIDVAKADQWFRSRRSPEESARSAFGKAR